jgi:hypothetical protein
VLRPRRWRAKPENRARLAELARRWYAKPENRVKKLEACRRWYARRKQDPGFRALLRERSSPQYKERRSEYYSIPYVWGIVNDEPI